MKVKGLVKSVIVSIFTSLVLVFTLGLGVGFFVDNKEPSFQAQKQFNDLTINQSFSDNQYLIINGKAYAYTNEQQDNTQVNPAAIMTNLYTLTFDKNNTLELIFLKEEYTSLNATTSTVFTIDNSDIASKFQAVKNEDGTVSIQIIDTSDVVEITTSTDADYTLYGLAFSTQATLNYANGEFSIGEKRGPVGLVDTTTKDKVQILNMANGSFTFSGDKTYSPKENTPGRAFYQTGGTLTLDGITLDGFWIPVVEGDLFSMIANPTEEMLGGTIYSSAGTLNLNCNVVNGISTLGCVAVEGTTNVTGGEYYNNFAMAGACIGTMYGTLNVENAAFYNNFAAAGTALTNLGGTLNITNCTVANNFTEMYGAITTMFGETTINSGNYFGNFGGAGSVCMLADNSTLIINDGEFYNNYTDWIGGVVNVCPLEDGAPATFTVNGGYYHDNYQEEAVTYTLPEKAALILGVAEEDRSMVIEPVNNVQGYVFFICNSASGAYGKVGSSSSIFNLNGGTLSNNVPEGAEYPAEIFLEDAEYITLGAELTQDISVIKPQAKAMALGDTDYAYIAHSTDSTILQSAVEHLQVQGIPLFPENLATDAVENYLVITSVTDYGLYNIETMEHVYSWQQLLDNGYINVSDTTVTGFDNSWDVYGLLIIPEHITAIADMAFAETEFVGGVYLPENLTSLGLGSFALSIGMSAFAVHKDNTAFVSMYGILLNYEQDRIVSVPPQMAQGAMEVPSMFTGAEAAACAGCIYLTDVILPSTFTQIEMGTFLYCTELKTIVIPDSVEYIGQAAFTYCQSAQLFDFRTATNIPVLETDKSMLGVGVFDYVPSDAKIYVPTELYYDWIAADGWSEYVDIIYADGVGLAGGPGVYDYPSGTLIMTWDQLKANDIITVSGGTLGFGSGASNLESMLTGQVELIIASEVTTIPDQLFYQQQWLGSVVIPSSVTSIGQMAFGYCAIEKVVIKDAPVNIGQAAFALNVNLKHLELGDNVRSYGQGALAITPFIENDLIINIPAGMSADPMAFMMCGAREVNYASNHSSARTYNGLVYSTDYKTLLYCPAGKVGPVSIRSSITAISDGAFMYCTRITGEIVVPDSVKSLKAEDNSSSSGNTINIGISIPIFSYAGMSSVILPEGITEIPASTFASCPNLTSVNIPTTVTTMGNSVFEDCDGLIEFTIPDTVTSIGTQFFQGCDNLKNVVVGNSVTSIPQYFCYECPNLETIVFGENVRSISSYTFTFCHKLKGTLVIPDRVTSIGIHAFQECSSLTGLDLGSGLTTIEDHVFHDCTSLTGTLTIPNSVTSIGRQAFQNCGELTKLNMGEGVQTIGQLAFYGCNKLTGELSLSSSLISIGQSAFREIPGLTGNLVFPATTQTIGIYAFRGCTGLTGLTIGGDSLAIAEQAFYGCTGVTSLTLNSGVISVGDSAFYGCNKIAGTLSFPSSLQAIHSKAFQNCTALTGLNFSNATGLTTVGDLAFYGCSNIAGTLNMPASLENIGQSAFRELKKVTGALNLIGNLQTIGAYAFQACTGITSITLGDSLISVADLAFYGCSGVTSLNLGKSLQTIGVSAFRNLTSLTGGLKFPDTVISIGNYAFHTAGSIVGVRMSKNIQTIGDGVFANCTNVNTYNFVFATRVPTLTNKNCFNGINANCRIYVPYNLYSEWIVAPNWADWADYIVGLDGGLFNYNTCELIYTWPQLETEGVVTVEGSRITDFVEPLYEYELVVASKITHIGEDAFEACSFLKSIFLTDYLVYIDDGAFASCSGLVEIDVPDSVTFIGISAFWSCTNLQRIKLPYGLLSIEAYTFDSCGRLVDIVIPNSVTRIGSHAFYRCYSLTNLFIPDSVTSIGTNAFQYCSNLQNINTASVEGWLGIEFENYYSNPILYSGNLFVNDVLLTKLEIPTTITSIKEYAFYGAYCLESVWGHSGITFIGSDAFNSCRNILVYDFTTAQSVITLSGQYYPLINNHPLLRIYVPVALYDDWIVASGWSVYKDNIIPSKPAGLYALDGTLTYLWSDLVSNSYVTVSNGNTITDFNDSLTGILYVMDTITQIGSSGLASNNLTEIYFNGKLTSIGSSAVQDSYLLEVFDIPLSVTSIGSYALDGCSKLKTVVIPNEVTTIGSWAFGDCSSLTDVNIGNSVSNIGNAAFANCYNLESVYIRSLEHWLNIDFYSRSSNPLSNGADLYVELIRVTELEIPEGITVIKPYAFSKATSITSLTMHDNITSIGDYAFYYCTGITSKVTMPSQLTSIGSDAFYCCYNIPEIELNDNLVTIGSYAFYNCNALTSVVIPNTVTTINDSAFSSIYSLTSLTLGNNLITIGNFSFSDCSALTGAITIPSKVETIGSYAFNSTSITSLTIPSSVKSIGGAAFASCSSLTTVTVNSNNPNYSSLNNIVYNKDKTELVFCAGGKSGSVTIPNTVITIKSSAFRGCTKITAITFGSAVQTIESSGFQNCTGLTGTIVLPSSLQTIGSYAFQNCTKITGITLPNSLTTIEYNAFSSCDALISMVIPDSVTSLGSSLFYSCDKLSSLTLPSTLATIPSDIIAYCTNLKMLTIPASVTTVDYHAFYYSKVVEYYFNNHTAIPTLGTDAFYGILSTTKIYVSESLYETWKTTTGWANYASYIYVYGAPGVYDPDTGELTYTWDELIANGYITIDGTTITGSNSSYVKGKLVIPYGITEIGSSAFGMNTNLKSVEFPSSLVTIEQEAFMMCSQLSSVKFNEGLKNIQSHAFYWTGLSGAITLPNSLTTIGNMAFGFAPGITSLTIGPNVSSIGTQILDPNIYGNNASVTTITVSSSNPYYSSTGPALFNKNKTTLLYFAPGWSGNYTVPSTVTRIATRAFANHRKLTGITMTSVQTIETEAFLTCTALQYVVFGSAISTLAQNSFYWDVGENPDAGDYEDFGSNVQYYNFNSATKVPTCSGSFINMISGSSYIYVPSSLLSSWKAASYWSTWADHIITGTPTLTTSLNDNGGAVANLLIATEENVETKSSNKVEVVIERVPTKDDDSEDDIDDESDKNITGSSGGDGNNDGTNVSANVPTKTTVT